jgi:hypothetical protein
MLAGEGDKATDGDNRKAGDGEPPGQKTCHLEVR